MAHALKIMTELCKNTIYNAYESVVQHFVRKEFIIINTEFTYCIVTLPVVL